MKNLIALCTYVGMFIFGIAFWVYIIRGDALLSGILMCILGMWVLYSLIWIDIAKNNAVSERIYTQKNEEHKFKRNVREIDSLIKDEDIRIFISSYTLDQLISINKRFDKIKENETSR